MPTFGSQGRSPLLASMFGGVPAGAPVTGLSLPYLDYSTGSQTLRGRARSLSRGKTKPAENTDPRSYKAGASGPTRTFIRWPLYLPSVPMLEALVREALASGTENREVKQVAWGHPAILERGCSPSWPALPMCLRAPLSHCWPCPHFQVLGQSAQYCSFSMVGGG